MPHYAHSLPNEPDRSRWETMCKHEERVASRCSEFLTRIAPELGPWGEILGRWHDLGKYRPEFQRKLAGEAVQIEHAGAGAALAAEKSPVHTIPIQFAIAGHHTGLANHTTNETQNTKRRPIKRSPLRERLIGNREVINDISSNVDRETIDLPIPDLTKWIRENSDRDSVHRQIDALTRILFSALVDADRLATQWFYKSSESEVSEETRTEFESLKVLRDRFDGYVDSLRAEKHSTRSAINELRDLVLDSCRKKASSTGGIFSLTVPTGGGKTFSAMSFALNHAIQNELDRVIIVIPYTSIIRQNANVYRKAFAKPNEGLDLCNIIEHHSAIDTQQAKENNPEAEKRREQAVENWDAPVIVTTSVQFFETLFSDHPSQCRKLHRIANSVVILDEIQTIPPQYVIPITDMIRELSSRYKTSIVLSTATPPALKEHLGEVREIVDDPIGLAKHPAARRVQTEWRIENPTTYEELANELKTNGHQQSLAIVHRRADAANLAKMLPRNHRMHLSAQMCPEHRIQAVDEILRRVKEGEPCLAVTTQLIEAGVDLDMPIVYRALAGADSLAQAAGRCDREGKRTVASGYPAGKLIVFRPETKPPGQTLQDAADASLTMWNLKALEGSEFDVFDPDHCREYFQHFYGTKMLDQHHLQRERASLNFANVAALFEMIEDGWSFPVVVPWPFNEDGSHGEGRRRSEAFRESPNRETSRALQPYIVQVPKHAASILVEQGVIEVMFGSIGIPTDLFNSSWYSDEFGLTYDEGEMSFLQC
ncbi:CRISPR-associated helicase/endonuclease Cas3 [Rhodopirellula europaea]|uniref:Metal dependent phosphohydrolase n=1 Tax=Rhodopirellula europaea 6C TaxID=1263867 RepID=M2ABG4_9BACT|nr:CRISPR-associated helicase/endonuclease Cas3 [Rhodopirellula europaea]EMB14050.1 metal dependent phosphohydrolase [Rhodopirellula europaea 6C]